MISTSVTLHPAWNAAGRTIAAHVAEGQLTVKVDETSPARDLCTTVAVHGEPSDVLLLLDELRAVAQKAIDVALLEGGRTTVGAVA
jgi:hypothetical protein